MVVLQNQNIINEIKAIITAARENVVRQINKELLYSYWNIGRIVVEYEQKGNFKADYGKKLLKSLSQELARELGKGFSVSNLQFMRRFYL